MHALPSSSNRSTRARQRKALTHDRLTFFAQKPLREAMERIARTQGLTLPALIEQTLMAAYGGSLTTLEGVPVDLIEVML